MASMKRSIARNMAKENMKAAGLVGFLKKKRYKDGDGNVKKQSAFSLRWRSWVNGNPFKKKKGKKNDN